MKTLFKNTFVQFIFAIMTLAAGTSAHAQSTGQDDSVFQGLGGKAGIDKIVADFIPIILADQRISRFFEKMDKQEFAAALSDQFCELTGGPCKYKGKDMRDTHEGMGISNAHFNALAEDLQIAMENNHISTSVANKLVAKLAPMQRPIVSK
jgi:hemoglobin